VQCVIDTISICNKLVDNSVTDKMIK